VRLAPNLAPAYVALGWALIWMRQHEAAIVEFERAIVLNPNLNDLPFAWTLVLAGEPARAVQPLKAHMRLDPYNAIPIEAWNTVLFASTSAARAFSRWAAGLATPPGR
jgi:tetratricopeptide (TPR) repeat protein